METLRPAFYAAIPRCVILDKSLTHGLRNLYCYLIARCSGEDQITWVSQQTIAEDLEMHRSHVNRDIKALAARGLITVRKSQEGRNVYLINDVMKVYGETARRPWDTRTTRVTPIQMSSDSLGTPPVPPESHPPVPPESHKETEGEETELRNRNMRFPGFVDPQLPTVGGADSPARVPKPKPPPTPKEMELGQRWLDHALTESPHGAKTYPSWNQEAFAREIAKIKKKGPYTDQQIELMIEFIKTEKQCWAGAAQSPAGMLEKRGSNGRRKIDNCYSSMRASKQMRMTLDNLDLMERLNSAEPF